MELRRIRYFVTIVEEGNISLAAKKLNMAQPPLSQQLKLLEEEVKMKLFERNTRKLILTDEGKFLYEKCIDILELIHRTEQEIEEFSDGISGLLNIGMIPSLGTEILPNKINDFHRRFPNVKFQVWDGDPNRIMELLEKRIIELGIVRLPIDEELFDSISLPDEPMIAAMSDSLDPTPNSPFIHLEQLKGKPLLLLRRHKGTSAYNHAMYGVDMVRSACKNYGFEPNILLESNSIMPLLTWADYGMGITIIPRSAAKLIPNSKLIFKQIVEPEVMARPSALIWLKNRHLSTLAKRFIEYFL